MASMATFRLASRSVSTAIPILLLLVDSDNAAGLTATPARHVRRAQHGRRDQTQCALRSKRSSLGQARPSCSILTTKMQIANSLKCGCK
eukprot:2580190-Pleurochrysis_carterae.AAC.4